MSKQEHVGAINEDSISSAISRLMEHPEIIGAVASALGASPPSPKQETNTATVSTAVKSEPDEQKDAPELVASLMPIISRLGGLGLGNIKSGGGGGTSRHSALLCALKPYLSKNRCDAIDYMLKISQMSDIISKLR